MTNILNTTIVPISPALSLDGEAPTIIYNPLLEIMTIKTSKRQLDIPITFEVTDGTYYQPFDLVQYIEKFWNSYWAEGDHHETEIN